MHIATLMQDQGRVVALDRSKGKVERILSNCQHWGVQCVEAYPYDATKAMDPHSGKAQHDTPQPPTHVVTRACSVDTYPHDATKAI